MKTFVLCYRRLYRVTLATLAKIYSTEHFCKAKVAGLGEICSVKITEIYRREIAALKLSNLASYMSQRYCTNLIYISV